MDTCDRCRAPWVTRWWKAEGRQELLLCGHHGRENGPALVSQGFTATMRLGQDADQGAPS